MIYFHFFLSNPKKANSTDEERAEKKKPTNLLVKLGSAMEIFENPENRT